MARRRKHKIPKLRNAVAASLADPQFKQRVAKKAHPRDYKPSIGDFDDD